MKLNWGGLRVWGFTWLIAAGFAMSTCSLRGAVLTWNPNPENENVAFYTVYIESPLGTSAHQVDGATRFDLVDLIPNVLYTLYVTATSEAGLESGRSAGVPYLIEELSPPKVLVQPSSVGAPFGSPLIISVSAAGTDLHYQWFKDGEILLGETNSTLAIGALSLLLQGSYHATIWNSLGSLETQRAFVSIAYPPLILTSPKSTNLATGGTILLTASSSGTRPFTYQWFKNDQPLIGATNALLLLSSARTNDSGAYRVDISNAAGTASTEVAVVAVIEPPQILIPPTGGHLVRGSLLRLSFIASGSGPFEYQWFFNNNRIPGATGAVFQIQSVTDANAGPYTVEISNSMGIATSQSAEVQVWAPITILQQPIATTNLLIGNELRLSVQASGPSAVSYQWFRGQVKLEGQNGSELVIPEVGSADAGNYSVTISSLAQTVVSATSAVTIIAEPPASDCSLSMIKNTSGQLGVTAQAPANATFDLQITESLSAPNWRRIATLTADATGRMETSISVGSTGSGFVRAVRR